MSNALQVVLLLYWCLRPQNTRSNQVLTSLHYVCYKCPLVIQTNSRYFLSAYNLTLTLLHFLASLCSFCTITHSASLSFSASKFSSISLTSIYHNPSLSSCLPSRALSLFLQDYKIGFVLALSQSYTLNTLRLACTLPQIAPFLALSLPFQNHKLYPF